MNQFSVFNLIASIFEDDDSEETSPREVERGDVIGVYRTGYEHYGVYVSNEEVIHYTSENSDIGHNKIMVTSFKRFLRDESEFFILNFPDNSGKASKSVGIANSFRSGDIGGPMLKGPTIFDLLRMMNYKRYSPDEIVERARSKIGEERYSLLLNNCEHFAIWCATNVSESQQIQKLLESAARNPIVY